MAVLRSGEKNTVFVALDGGKFEPRTVTLGPRAENNLYQVLSGLKEGERVVTSGQFMLDSESQLREAIQKMLEPSDAGRCAPARDGTKPCTPVAPLRRIIDRQPHQRDGLHLPDARARGHRVRSPGQMSPLRHDAGAGDARQTLAKLQPGGRVEYYTCPMPEHSDVQLRTSPASARSAA